MYGHRQIVAQPIASRFGELLDALKNEYDGLFQEFNLYKHQREDFEMKLQVQVGEIVHIQKTLLELERTHLRMKQQYEEEIGRLQRKVGGSHGGDNDAADLTQRYAHVHSSASPPNLESEMQAYGATSNNANTNNASTGSGSGGGLLGANSLYPLDAATGGSTTQQSKRSGEDQDGRNSRIKVESSKGVTGTASASGGSSGGGGAASFPTSAGRGTVVSSNGVQVVGALSPTAATSNGVVSNSQVDGSGSGGTATASLGTQTLPLSIGGSGSTIGGGGGSGGNSSGGKKDTTYDWLVVYNPKQQRTVSVDLMHNLPHDSVVCCVRFSPDGKFLATGGNKRCYVFNVQTGERLCHFTESSDAEGGDFYTRSVCFSSDGKLLAAGSEDRIIRVWDLQNRKIKARLLGHEQDIYSIEFLPDGKQLISGSGDRTIRLWDVESATCKVAFTVGAQEGKECGITSVALSPNGRYVAAGALDRVVRVWDLVGRKMIDSFEGHGDSVYSVAFTPDGKTIVSASLDKSLKLWDFDAENPGRNVCRNTVFGHKDFVLSVTCSPNGRWILSGSKDRSVQFWDPQLGATQLMLQGHKNSVISVAVSPTGDRFATGSGDCRARIWSLNLVSV